MTEIVCPTHGKTWKRSNLPFPYSPFILECNECAHKEAKITCNSKKELYEILAKNYLIYQISGIRNV